MNKVIWSIAAFLAVMLFGILSFIGVKVWDISERMVKVETIIADRLR